MTYNARVRTLEVTGLRPDLPEGSATCLLAEANTLPGTYALCLPARFSVRFRMRSEY